MTEQEIQKAWEINLFNAIKNVSDIEMQRMAWLGKSQDIVSSFDEVIAILYDDFDFEGYIDYYQKTHGNDELLPLMKELDQLISEYLRLPPATDGLILQDPEWVHITEKAAEVYRRLRGRDSNLTL